uniref:Uncharacterized protein n=1 Tax=Oryza glumipatula TaxID=40148 RepID=A0A0D9YI65_9ORYZ
MIPSGEAHQDGCREETCWLQPARAQEAAEAGSNEREVEAVARGPVAGASAAAGRRRSGGRGRRGVDDAQGLRHVDGRHLVRVETVLQAADLSVLMPGQRYPTYLAQPAPLPPAPCPREGVHWPPHDHDVHHSYMPP